MATLGHQRAQEALRRACDDARVDLGQQHLRGLAVP